MGAPVPSALRQQQRGGSSGKIHASSSSKLLLRFRSSRRDHLLLLCLFVGVLPAAAAALKPASSSPELCLGDTPLQPCGPPSAASCRCLGSTCMICRNAGLTSGDLAFLAQPQFASLETLDLSHNDFSQPLPHATFANLSKLNHLDLQSSRITVLPTTPGLFSSLSHLNLLSLSDNDVTTVSGGMFAGLTSLTVLYMNNNAISSLQGVFDSLPYLITLDLGLNRISRLPNDLFSRQSLLDQVVLEGNLLTALPPAFCGTNPIRQLYLSSNRIKTLLPDALTGCKNLTLLFLDSNQFTDLPPLPVTSALKLVSMASNSLTSPHPLQSALNAFNQQQPPGTLAHVDLSSNAVSCFVHPKLASLGAGLDVAYACTCSTLFEYHAISGTCVSPPRGGFSTADVVGSVFGGMALAGVVAAAIVFLQRFRTLRHDLGETEQLLMETRKEVDELKSAWTIHEDDVKLEKRIDIDSEGAFGEVWLGLWDGLQVAVKRLRSAVFNDDDTADFDREVDFMTKCRHRNIVRFFGAGRSSRDALPFLVLEYLEFGALSGYLAGTPAIPWLQKLSFINDIQNAMEYIHTLGRIHRDLKTGNVLLSASLRAKVADFGSMKGLLSQAGFELVTADAFESKKHAPLSSRPTSVMSVTSLSLELTCGVGTPWYMAPEVIASRNYGQSADVWSFGVVLWEIATQQKPDALLLLLKGQRMSGPILGHLERALLAGARLPVEGRDDFDAAPKGFVDIMTSCWELVPTGRPSFALLGERLADMVEGMAEEETHRQ